MRRIVIAIGLSGLLAACGQQAGPAGEPGAPVGELDYIDAVPIDEDAHAPIAQPEAAAKTDEPEEDSEPQAEEEAEVEAEPAPTPTPAPASPAPATTAAEATRRANESTATPYLSAPRPD